MICRCLICVKELRTEDLSGLPVECTTFSSYGGYDSGFFDGFADTMAHSIEIYICDNCMQEKKELVTYLQLVREEKRVVKRLSRADYVIAYNYLLPPQIK